MKWRNSGGEFVQPPTGTFLARCVRLTDLGTQTSEYEGTTRVRRQVLIGWELPEELMTTGEAAGQPFLTSKFYTQSLHENATLRKDLINWRGRDFTDEELEGFDAKNILGHPCMLTLTDVKDQRHQRAPVGQQQDAQADQPELHLQSGPGRVHRRCLPGAVGRHSQDRGLIA
jgi:hypothetical protein